MEHFKSLSAVFPIILREYNGQTQVLLHRRQNTGYMDGKWDFAGSGHVEEGETASEAAVRECSEETGLIVSAQDAQVAHLGHRIGAHTYYDIYFFFKSFTGSPQITEPEKCSALEWFEITALPEEMIPIRRQAFQDALSGKLYSELREEKQ